MIITNAIKLTPKRQKERFALRIAKLGLTEKNLQKV